MTYTETQLEAIKLFGRKDLTEGCLVHNGIKYWKIALMDGPIMVYVPQENDSDFHSDNYYWHKDKIEILGHIPHWHDLFLALQDKGLESFLGSESLLIDPDEKMGKKKYIEVNKYISLLDQPNLSDILDLFK